MIPNNFATRWASIITAAGVSLHYGAVGVFKAEDAISKTLSNTKRAIIHDLATANGYAPMIGGYIVDEARASLDEIQVFIDDAALRHYKKSPFSLNQFRKLLKAIALNESTHNNEALSLAGAIGVGQIMPFNVKICGLNNAKHLIDPESNVDCMAQIVAKLGNGTKGDLDSILSLYNWGKLPGGKNGPLPAETKKYIADVLQDYHA